MFAPVTIVQPANAVRECTNTYLGHIGETHYVSTVENTSSELNHKQCSQISVEDKVVDKTKKCTDYMRQYTRKRRTGMEFREKDNAKLIEGRYYINN